MKHLKIFTTLAIVLGLFGCKKSIDLYPQSNLSTGTYYKNAAEVRSALNGSYNAMQTPMVYEWQLTELRSDNTKLYAPGSTAVTNRDLSDLDMFTPSTSHQGNYNYWLNTYFGIRTVNIILQKLGVTYNPADGTLTFNPIEIAVSDEDRKQLAGEAMFIRAYHYFNLVRLYGGVFLIHTPVGPAEAKLINRSSVADIYKLIEADLTTAAANLSKLTYSQMVANSAANLGRANAWSAKGLLGKVYLTQNKKTEAIIALQDVMTNSGYSLLGNYANVFATNNEMNAEILFAIRYKAGGLGVGSPFANTFAPLGSGSNVIRGDGKGLNYPTADIDTLTNGDTRKNTLLGSYQNKLYIKKFFSEVTVADDAENDWTVLRYADILLMMAEAQGYNQSSLDFINAVRPRAGLGNYTMQNVPDVATFEKALSDERRIEFAFENQRFFDLIRFNTTLTTLTSEQLLKDHFKREFVSHYANYVAPAPTLAELYAQTTREKMLLPIPQREIDTNTQMVIGQNPGY